MTILNLLASTAPAQPTLFDGDPLHSALDNPLPPRATTPARPRVAGDELFPDEQPQRPVLTIAARCAVHDLPIQIPAAGLRLCGDCLTDLARPRARRAGAGGRRRRSWPRRPRPTMPRSHAGAKLRRC